MAQYGTVRINVESDLSEFRKSVRRVLNAVEELDTALNELNTTPVKINFASGGIVSNEEVRAHANKVAQDLAKRGI